MCGGSPVRDVGHAPPSRSSRLDFKTIVTVGAPNSYGTPNIGIAADDRYRFNEPTHRPSRATHMNAHDALSSYGDRRFARASKDVRGPGNVGENRPIVNDRAGMVRSSTNLGLEAAASAHICPTDEY